MNKRTLVLGASENPERYAHQAAIKLLQHHHSVVLLGNKAGQIAGIPIFTGKPTSGEEHIHTITIYLSAKNQIDWHNYLLALKPQRIIFNPGAENHTLAQLAIQQGIEVLEACTLVMLSIGNY